MPWEISTSRSRVRHVMILDENGFLSFTNFLVQPAYESFQKKVSIPHSFGFNIILFRGLFTAGGRQRFPRRAFLGLLTEFFFRPFAIGARIYHQFPPLAPALVPFTA